MRLALCGISKPKVQGCYTPIFGLEIKTFDAGNCWLAFKVCERPQVLFPCSRVVTVGIGRITRLGIRLGIRLTVRLTIRPMTRLMIVCTSIKRWLYLILAMVECMGVYNDAALDLWNVCQSGSPLDAACEKNSLAQQRSLSLSTRRIVQQTFARLP